MTISLKWGSTHLLFTIISKGISTASNPLPLSFITFLKLISSL